MEYVYDLWAKWFKTRREDLDIVFFVSVDSRRCLNQCETSAILGKKQLGMRGVHHH